MTTEATLNPDGSTVFGNEQNGTSAGDDGASNEGESFFDGDASTKHSTASGFDPAVYVLFAFLAVAALYYFFVVRKKAEDNEDEFFSNLDVEKVSSPEFS